MHCVCACTTLAAPVAVPPELEEYLGWIPSLVVKTFNILDMELRTRVLQLLDEIVLPKSLTAANRAAGVVHIFGNLEPEAKVVFGRIQATRQRIQRALLQFASNPQDDQVRGARNGTPPNHSACGAFVAKYSFDASARPVHVVFVSSVVRDASTRGVVLVSLVRAGCQDASAVRPEAEGRGGCPRRRAARGEGPTGACSPIQLAPVLTQADEVHLRVGDLTVPMSLVCRCFLWCRYLPNSARSRSPIQRRTPCAPAVWTS
jgi:hypothetical protein